MKRRPILKLFTITLLLACAIGTVPLWACKTVFEEPQLKVFSQNSDPLNDLKSYLAALTDQGSLTFHQLSDYFEFDTPLPSINSSLIIHENALRNWKTKQSPESMNGLLNWIKGKINEEMIQSQKERTAEQASKDAFRPIHWVQIKDPKSRPIEVMDSLLTWGQYFDLFGMNSEIVQRRLNSEGSSAFDIDKNILIHGLDQHEILAISNALSKRMGAPAFYPKELLENTGNIDLGKATVASYHYKGHLGVRIVTTDDLLPLIKRLKANRNYDGGKDTYLPNPIEYIFYDEQDGIETWSIGSSKPLYFGEQNIYDIDRLASGVFIKTETPMYNRGTGYLMLTVYKSDFTDSDLLMEEHLMNLTRHHGHAGTKYRGENICYYFIRLAMTVRPRR